MEKLIKMVVQNVLNNWDLTDYAPGTVVDIDPIRVKINEKVIIEAGNIVLTASLPQFAVGDKLVMLSTCRNQKYIILGKAVASNG